MLNSETGNSKFLKAYNEAGILDLIRTGKALTRADLSKATGLSPTAAGVIVSALIEKGYLHEIGSGESKGGRKPVLLELKPDSYYSIGFDIDVDSIYYIMMDTTGRVIYENSRVLRLPAPDAAISALLSCMEEITESFSIGMDKLLGIGISVPGMVDAATQKVVLAPNLGWENVDLCAMLKARLDLPVYIENEAMASAICENWIGACQEVSNFVCINIRSGIGAGIFTGGRPYKGAGGSAGEVGHIVVEGNGMKCGCGNSGCLETIASTGRIVEKARKTAGQNIISNISLTYIVEAARAGNAEMMGLLDDAAGYLGTALSGIVNTLNPSKIVLGKDFTKYGDLVMDLIRGVVDRKALRRPAANVELIVSEIGERSSTLGASIVPLKILFGR
ncbi:MAG: ROK family transcriptional regulator [Clostridiaceae bacterium]